MLVLISVVGVIGSLYVLQMGIVRTEPITVSMLFGVNLVITFLVQFFDPRLHQSVSTFVGVALVCGFMCLGTWARYRGSKRAPVEDVTETPA